MNIRNIVIVTAIFFMMLHSASPDTIIKPDATWTEVEAWTWQQIQLGKEVRLSNSCPNRENGETHRNSDADISDFSLRGAFLQQILTEAPYRDVTAKQPIVLHGAHIVGNIVADGGISQGRVVVSCSTLDGAVLFNDWDFLHRVHFHDVTAKSIRIRDVDAKSRVTISRSVVRDIEISESRINGSLSFRNTHVQDKIEIINTRVENSLLMGCTEARSSRRYCSTYGLTHFGNLSVGRSIHLVGSHFKESLIFESIELAGNLIADHVHFSDFLVFIGGTIAGRIYMNKSSSEGVLSLIGTVALGGLDLSEGRHGTVKILNSDIYRDLDVSEADIAFFLDITGTRVHGALKLLPLSAREQAKADAANKGFRRHFSARNAHVRVLEDTRDAWDRWSVLDLSGFEYDKLSSASTSVRLRADNAYSRDAEWFKDWLESMETYSPQPYIQLSSVLRREGQFETANAILFEGKERERIGLSWMDGRRWWIELLRYTIGYGVGLRAFYALGWMALLATVGWLLTTRRAIRNDSRVASVADRFWFSMTFTIPGFSLVKRDELTVSPGAQRWLYVQRLVCFTLALLAGAAAVGLVRP